MAGPVTVLYFYKTRWGSHDEFVELFERNHLPVLKAQIETGRLLNVHRFVPRFHGEGRADWDVLVTIIYRDWAALEDHSEVRWLDPGHWYDVAWLAGDLPVVRALERELDGRQD